MALVVPKTNYCHSPTQPQLKLELLNNGFLAWTTPPTPPMKLLCCCFAAGRATIGDSPACSQHLGPL
jgi:hypothetical protein